MSSNQNCPYCNPINNIKYTQKEIENTLYDKTNGEYMVLGKYKNINSKLTVKHTECGHIWDVTPKHFIYNDSRCPLCATSKGEKAIREYLLKNKVNFYEEYTFSDCRDIGLLRFDFAIFKNNNLFCLIEYDGEQHFEGWRGDLESFNNIQRRDNIKNNYCKQNNIKLIRIPYWDFSNLDSILYKKLSEVISDAG